MEATAASDSVRPDLTGHGSELHSSESTRIQSVKSLRIKNTSVSLETSTSVCVCVCSYLGAGRSVGHRLKEVSWSEAGGRPD